MSGDEKMNWIIFFFSPVKAELFIVVLFLPRDHSDFLPAYVSSHVEHSGIRWVHKQIQAASGFKPEASARQSATLSTAPPAGDIRDIWCATDIWPGWQVYDLPWIKSLLTVLRFLSTQRLSATIHIRCITKTFSSNIVEQETVVNTWNCALILDILNCTHL